MKNLLVLGLFFLCSHFSFSQSFFETSWISNDVKYTAFFVQHTDVDAFICVKYFMNGSERVALYESQLKTFTKSNGATDKYWDGFDATMKRGAAGASYNADNFYVKSLGNGKYEAFTADDKAFDGGDFTDYMKPTLYWISLQKEAVTTRYLDDYLDSDDLIYQLLSFFGNGQAEFETTDTAITVVGHGISHYNPPYDEGEWVVAMSDLGSSAYTKQNIKTSETFPNEWIKQQWGEGYFITDISYDSFMGQFLVVMSKGPNINGPQSWKKSDTFPKDWIKEKWDDSHHITSIAYGAGNWYLAMTKNTGLSTQRWKTSYEFPKSWISDNWNEGFAITSATYGGGVWAFCMSKGANLGRQTWKTSEEYPLDWIREKAGEDYKITSIAYGNGQWFIAMSDTPNIRYNTSFTGLTELPIDRILEKASGPAY
ncbi:hypothetical protein [Allomuricauda sp. NBRC 101325]|uniref:DUF7477 domain-containing protein n=1 Tax=Allomuricauda sp. NBRC 101325 TaxID=1113758 RepID=UPI0024A4C4BA|nr:hypothetical protein [Muricauda sp. NBRC 101325]GLU44201.1 hypothetical protein Musp01_18250 [Muricauda sp. NBRC 101325]